MGNENSTKHRNAMSPTSPQHLLSKGIRTMDRNLQRKFKHGAQYNMKVVIRGDVATGKTTMMKRLEGGPFIREHYATPQIQTATINWNYKITDEVVKVEVWDIVDKISNNSNNDDMIGADASTINVYQGTNAVVVLVDPTRKWTFDYAKEIISNIPKHIDVLLLVNFRDLESRRVVSRHDIEEYMRTQEEHVHHMECSMLDCFGLKQVYTFLNIPFLKLQRKTLQQQLDECEVHLKQALEEAEFVFSESYEAYTKNMKNRHEMMAKVAKTPPPPSSSKTIARTDPLPSKKKHRKIVSAIVSKDDSIAVANAIKERRDDTNVEDVLAGFDPGEIAEEGEHGFFDDDDDDDDSSDSGVDDVEIQPISSPIPQEANMRLRRDQVEISEDDDDELEIPDVGIEIPKPRAITQEKRSPHDDDDDDDDDELDTISPILKQQPPSPQQEEEDNDDDDIIAAVINSDIDNNNNDDMLDAFLADLPTTTATTTAAAATMDDNDNDDEKVAKKKKKRIKKEKKKKKKKKKSSGNVTTTTKSSNNSNNNNDDDIDETTALDDYEPPDDDDDDLDGFY